MTDTFPSGMAVHTTPGITGPATATARRWPRDLPASTLTGVAGATSAVVSGAIIPGGSTSGGSCSFSIRVSATVANLYTNDIPVGTPDHHGRQQYRGRLGRRSRCRTSRCPTCRPSASRSTRPPPRPPWARRRLPSSFPTRTRSATRSPAALQGRIADQHADRQYTCADRILFLKRGLVTRPAATTITGTAGSTSATIPSTASFPGAHCPPAAVAASACGYHRLWRASAPTPSHWQPDHGFGQQRDRGHGHLLPAGQRFLGRQEPARRSHGRHHHSQSRRRLGTDHFLCHIAYGIQEASAGTRTFTDTLPVLITPTLSMVTATVAGATGCRDRDTVAGSPGPPASVARSRERPMTGAAKSRLSPRQVSRCGWNGHQRRWASTPSPARWTPTPSNNTSTVVLVIKPAANLTITKDDGKTVLLTGSTNAYTITVANGGPASADGAVLKDPAATGLNCTDITCSAVGWCQLSVTGAAVTWAGAPSGTPSGRPGCGGCAG
jgi:uncharacterized repeat protein (TIGR01451 family)